MKILAPLLLLGLLFTSSGFAQNDVVVSEGKEQKGTISKYLAKEKKIEFESEGFKAQFPTSAYSSITLAQRPDYKKALEAMDANNPKEAIRLLQPLVDNYLGLPSKWLLDAATTLAQALADDKQRQPSLDLYNRISEAYPESSARFLGDVGKARDALARKQWDDALKVVDAVEPKLPEDAKSPVPAGLTRQLLSDIWFIRGVSYEGKGQKQEALTAFLKVTTLYYQPEDQAKDAQEHIDNLRKADPKLRAE